ncbi:hypothetical protein PGT21_023061 [Puccinia graminis f. sp. tritici]|uniref:Uncharacterized protein n=1 Tax=Puccinia graminis f. sp. tritici TaxID=56615 RepID=A0A5B0QUW6_PUCGR|nr:hypothetical protein PGT21_023061 [Puccinia graminis f. sp. tritici]
MEASHKSAPKETRAKSANKNPVVNNNKNMSSPTLEPTKAPVNPTITLDASQDSGGDESVDLMSKNPILSMETLKDIAGKTVLLIAYESMDKQKPSLPARSNSAHPI